MSTKANDLEEFVCKEVASLCDADPQVLAQYITALIGTGECNDALRASLDDKLKEFFDDQTAPFIDRLFRKLSNNGNSKPPREASDRFNAYSDEEDDDGDRNFKHRRQRSEGRNRSDYSEQNKRRYTDESQYQNTKFFRTNNNDERRGQYQPPSQFSSDRGRGRGGYRGNVGMNRPFSKPPMCRDYIEKGFCMKGDVCPFDHGRDRIIVEDSNKPSYGPPSVPGNIAPNRGMNGQPFVGSNDAYDPERASLLPMNSNFNGDLRGSRRGRGGGRGGRGGFRYGQNNNPTNTTLTVEKIPAEVCQIAAINEYFTKFGTIINISVQPHAQKAIIQYSTRAEAEKAYTCPDVIFDNRFIKVYWNKDEVQNTAPVVEEPPVVPKPVSNEPDPEVVAARAAEFAKLREEKQKKHQESMKNILELQKRRENELQKQISEQKRLLDSLSNSANMSSEEKASILQQLKSVQSFITGSQTAKNLVSTEPVVAEPAVPVKATESKEPTSAELQKKLEQLEAEAAALGVHTGSPYAAHGGFAGRGRNTWTRGRGGLTKMTLDNRPTKIIVNNIPQDASEEELRRHFEQYGTVSLFEKSESEATVQYMQRFMAEKAMSYGPNFAKGKLQLSWYNQPANPNEASST
ncbi:hypothetical protein BY458DRAFT_585363 [Sporodiniella umbellata]|nr:hypothetical protein BY458DRAFT_585363 [Sporodiniella umbellata]